MVSTFTPNIQLEEPARGDQVGTWDTPVNANMTLLDLVTGGITAISLNNSPVVLASAQYQCKTITFQSTLTGSVTITFPTSFKKSYEIQHLCTGSSAFTITLTTTAAGAQQICCPPGEITDVINDGTNLKFRNLGRVGEYWDYAGSSTPNWVSGCTRAPYLPCDGSAVSSATYPVLFGLIGATTPDFRGRETHYLNQGTGRLTSTGAGIDGNTIFATGGSNGVALGSSHVPTITSSGTNSITVTSSMYMPAFSSAVWTALAVQSGAIFTVPYTNGAAGTLSSGINTMTNSSQGISVTFTNSSQQNVPATTPGLVGGIRMIRAG